MIALTQGNALVTECKVTHTENAFVAVGTFQLQLVIDDSKNELEQIETQIERAGQQFKRNVCHETLQAADERCVKLFQKTQPHLHKNGKSPFTFVMKFGHVTIKRQRLRHSQTGKTVKPSAVLWQTSHHHHISQQTIEAACESSQVVSYRKAAKQLANEAGEEQLIATSTVWNKKQEKGKELVQKQNDFVEQVLTHKETPPLVGVPSDSTRSIEADTIQVQLDEVKTRSQEPEKKWNLTYTATLETQQKECFYLAAESSAALIQQVVARLTVLGLYLGKRLEVVSDGATWISDWVRSVQGVVVEQVLCWYHLRKRIYEGLGALGFAKDRRILLQKEILGHLWRGRTAAAVWILWGLRPPSRPDQRRPNRIDELIGYLLRKRRQIVDYESRRERGLWLASTRVEKWNDLAVTIRCKHNGMSWTTQGVLAVALYAAKQKQDSISPQTAQIDTEYHTTS